MTEEQYDSWDLSDAPVLGEGLVTINSASFGYDAQYGGGEVALAILEGTVESDGDTHSWKKLYSIGKGWNIVDGGSRVEREDGRKRNFQKQSKYGLWIAGALEAGAGEVLRGRGTPMEAKIWEHLTFEVAAKETDYGGEIGKKSTLVPVKFVGEAGTATPAATKAAAPAANGSSNGHVSGALKMKLKKLAAECDSHDAFVERAFVEVEGVDGNAAVEKAVADSTELYESLRG